MAPAQAIPGTMPVACFGNVHQHVYPLSQRRTRCHVARQSHPRDGHVCGCGAPVTDDRWLSKELEQGLAIKARRKELLQVAVDAGPCVLVIKRGGQSHPWFVEGHPGPGPPGSSPAAPGSPVNPKQAPHQSLPAGTAPKPQTSRAAGYVWGPAETGRPNSMLAPSPVSAGAPNPQVLRSAGHTSQLAINSTLNVTSEFLPEPGQQSASRLWTNISRPAVDQRWTVAPDPVSTLASSSARASALAAGQDSGTKAKRRRVNQPFDKNQSKEPRTQHASNAGSHSIGATIQPCFDRHHSNASSISISNSNNGGSNRTVSSTVSSSPEHNNTTRHCAPRHSTKNYSNVQPFTLHHNHPQLSKPQQDTAQHSTTQRDTTHHSIPQHDISQHATSQPSSPQHRTAPKSTWTISAPYSPRPPNPNHRHDGSTHTPHHHCVQHGRGRGASIVAASASSDNATWEPATSQTAVVVMEAPSIAEHHRCTSDCDSEGNLDADGGLVFGQSRGLEQGQNLQQHQASVKRQESAHHQDLTCMETPIGCDEPGAYSLLHSMPVSEQWPVVEEVGGNHASGFSIHSAAAAQQGTAQHDAAPAPSARHNCPEATAQLGTGPAQTGTRVVDSRTRSPHTGTLGTQTNAFSTQVGDLTQTFSTSVAVPEATLASLGGTATLAADAPGTDEGSHPKKSSGSTQLSRPPLQKQPLTPAPQADAHQTLTCGASAMDLDNGPATESGTTEQAASSTGGSLPAQTNTNQTRVVRVSTDTEPGTGSTWTVEPDNGATSLAGRTGRVASGQAASSSCAGLPTQSGHAEAGTGKPSAANSDVGFASRCAGLPTQTGPLAVSRNTKDTTDKPLAAEPGDGFASMARERVGSGQAASSSCAGKPTHTRVVRVSRDTKAGSLGGCIAKLIRSEGAVDVLVMGRPALKVAMYGLAIARSMLQEDGCGRDCKMQASWLQVRGNHLSKRRLVMHVCATPMEPAAQPDPASPQQTRVISEPFGIENCFSPNRMAKNMAKLLLRKEQVTYEAWSYDGLYKVVVALAAAHSMLHLHSRGGRGLLAFPRLHTRSLRQQERTAFRLTICLVCYPDQTPLPQSYWDAAARVPLMADASPLTNHGWESAWMTDHDSCLASVANHRSEAPSIMRHLLACNSLMHASMMHKSSANSSMTYPPVAHSTFKHGFMQNCSRPDDMLGRTRNQMAASGMLQPTSEGSVLQWTGFNEQAGAGQDGTLVVDRKARHGQGKTREDECEYLQKATGQRFPSEGPASYGLAGAAKGADFRETTERDCTQMNREFDSRQTAEHGSLLEIADDRSVHASGQKSHVRSHPLEHVSDAHARVAGTGAVLLHAGLSQVESQNVPIVCSATKLLRDSDTPGEPVGQSAARVGCTEFGNGAGNTMQAAGSVLESVAQHVMQDSKVASSAESSASAESAERAVSTTSALGTTGKVEGSTGLVQGNRGRPAACKPGQGVHGSTGGMQRNGTKLMFACAPAQDAAHGSLERLSVPPHAVDEHAQQAQYMDCSSSAPHAGCEVQWPNLQRHIAFAPLIRYQANASHVPHGSQASYTNNNACPSCLTHSAEASGVAQRAHAPHTPHREQALQIEEQASGLHIDHAGARPLLQNDISPDFLSFDPKLDIAMEVEAVLTWMDEYDKKCARKETLRSKTRGAEGQKLEVKD